MGLRLAVGILDYWGGGEVGLHVPISSNGKSSKCRCRGILAYPVFALSFAMYIAVGVQPQYVAEEIASPSARLPSHFAVLFLLATVFLLLSAAGVAIECSSSGHGSNSADVFGQPGSGDRAGSQTWRPRGRKHPLGYLIEADVLWWKFIASGWRENTHDWFLEPPARTGTRR